MKKALVIGGCGFIGSNIVKILSEKNYSIRVFDNLSTGRLKNIADYNVEFIQGDISNENEVTDAMKTIDYVFHLAANIGNLKSLNDPVFDSTINVIGTLNVLSAARKNNIKKLVYSSSAAIYGELLYQPIDEKHPLEPESPYGVSKLAGEKHCLWFGRHYGIDVICLRYFNVYGINQYSDEYGNVIPKWVDLILNDKPIKIYGDGSQTRDFVNVIDVANANVMAAEKSGLSGFFNVSSGASITINALATLLTSIMKPDTTVIYEPFRKGEVIHCKADISKAATSFGFKPGVGLENGLTEYVEWIKKGSNNQ